MPLRWAGILICLLVSVSMARAQGDVMLLRIGTDSVSKGEFEYYFKHSLAESSQDFLPSFIEYKAKSLYAKDLGLDTLSNFVAQKLYYIQALKAFKNITPIEQKQVDVGDWIKIRHITTPMGQHVTKREQLSVKNYMDSIYSVLKKDTDVKNKIGEAFWFPKKYLLSEWLKVLNDLGKEEVSIPFYSPLGVHIVYWEDEKKVRMISDDLDSCISDLDYRISEINDALLVRSLTARYQCSYTEGDLEIFFSKNKSAYVWDFPHYKGAVFHCKTKKKAKAIKKYLKQYDMYLWKEMLDKLEPSFWESYKMEYGLFQIGKNKYVDKLVFKCGEFEPLENYPYTIVVGKKLRGPMSYQDIREKVVEDYLQAQEKRLIDVVKQKYKVEINEEVLKTVNNSRSN